MNRRSFFRNLAVAAAGFTVFRKVKLPEPMPWDVGPTRCLFNRPHSIDSIDIFTDAETAKGLKEAMVRYYEDNYV